MELKHKFSLNQIVYEFINDKIIEYKITRLPIWEPGEYVYLLEATGIVESYLKYTRSSEEFLYSTRKECIENAKKNIRKGIERNEEEIEEKKEEIKKYKRLLLELD